MTKHEIITQLVENHGLTLKKAGAVYDNIWGIITSQLVDASGSVLTPLGTFSVIDVKERNGVNPQTKEKIVIPAHAKIKFKPSTSLKKAIQE